MVNKKLRQLHKAQKNIVGIVILTIIIVIIVVAIAVTPLKSIKITLVRMINLVCRLVRRTLRRSPYVGLARYSVLFMMDQCFSHICYNALLIRLPRQQWQLPLRSRTFPKTLLVVNRFMHKMTSIYLHLLTHTC